jgi:hypothetical protein
MDAHQLAPAWFRVGFSPLAVLIAFTLTVAMAVLGAAVAGVAPQIGYVRLMPGSSTAAVRARLAAAFAQAP